jgi:hypothetical protein
MKKLYIKRDLEKKIVDYTGYFAVVAITGARQTGKSTVLAHVFGKDYKYISLDDLAVRSRAKTDPKLFLDDLGEKVIIDEIQYAPELLSYIKIKVDEKPHIKGRYILTGSQQFLMMKNFSETLAGRIGILNMFPFSVAELRSTFLEGDLNLRKIFYSYCVRGGYPELYVNKKIPPEVWYKAYIKTYLERDIKILYDIGKLTEFNNFIQIIASRNGQILNMSSLASEMNLSVNTIKSWISILQASNIIYLLHPYFGRAAKRLIRSPKIYFYDIGLACHLNRINSIEQLREHNLFGAMFENFCIVEILKHFKNIDKEKDMYYFRTGNGLEVDLLIQEGMEYIPVEIKASMSIKANMAKNIDQLKDNFKKLKTSRGYLLSLSEEDFSVSKNVRAVPLFDFLGDILSDGGSKKKKNRA